MRLDLTHATHTSVDVTTEVESLKAARAQGYGTWRIIEGALHIYGNDESTIVHTFTLDNPTIPSRRISASTV